MRGHRVLGLLGAEDPRSRQRLEGFRAPAALFEAARQGWRVPKDLAIASFGDSALALACWPRLSALRVPSRLIGERAGQLLLARLRDEPGAPRGLRVDVGTEWVARDSA